MGTDDLIVAINRSRNKIVPKMICSVYDDP
jgi:hypothetical protein